MARIRTLNFLPEIFQTPTNAEFLSATLDQLTSNPVTTRVQGYVGSRFGSGVNALNYYVTEPTKTRTDYQLDPGVVFTKTDESVAQDFITYPGIIDSLKQQGAVTNNNNRLFESQFYSWDSFTNLDKIVNHYEYYWLPEGPPVVTVSPSVVFTNEDYIVGDLPNAYELTEVGSSNNTGLNPTISLLRGGTYNFFVNQDSPFYIQTIPSVTGFNPDQPFVSVRDVFGVTNNGTTDGAVTFNVPSKTAQNNFIFPGNNFVDVVSTTPFDQVNGKNLYDVFDPSTGITYPGLGNIDGVVGLNGLRVMFYNDGVPNEIGYVSSYYDGTNYDVNDPLFTEPQTVTISSTTATGNFLSMATGFTTDEIIVNQTVTFTAPLLGGLQEGQVYFVKEILNSTDFTISTSIGGATVSVGTDSGFNTTVNINQGQYEQGFYTSVSENYYRIQFVGDPNNPVLRLLPDGIIPNEENITPRFGEQWINRTFYRNTLGVISLVPTVTAPLDTLYYQDGTNPNKVGVIKIIENTGKDFIDVDTEILGKINYTSPTGVQFTNGLKVSFDGNIFPIGYRTGQYYVEGVGTGIELVSVDELVTPESFSAGAYIPWDEFGFDIGSYDISLNIPVDPDYITIARNSISRNAWARSNRWFHIDVINASAQYNNNPNILTEYVTPDNKAKRPIIEFYPNLRLFDSGAVGKRPIDFFDTRAVDALSDVAGLLNYYPDVETYTTNTATVAATPTTLVNVVDMEAGKTYSINVSISLGATGQAAWNTLAGTIGVFYQTGDEITCQIDGNELAFPGSSNGRLIYDETTVVIPNDQITGIFQIGMYLGDTLNIVPTNSQITDLTDDGTDTTLTITWPYPQDVLGGVTSVVGTDTLASNYAVFPGARIVFSNDSNEETKHTIYVVDIVTTILGQEPNIVLIKAEDSNVGIDEQVAIKRGYNNQGKTFYYTGLAWNQAQQKVTVNQAPFFDVFDENDISLGDSDIYGGTTFRGCTLFAYGINPLTVDDPILGFPVRYSDVANIADISFDVTINSDTFNYVRGFDSITQKVNTGYVYNYTAADAFTRELGWQTAVENSVQYQLFSFKYDILNPPTQFVCDIAALPEVPLNSKGWPRVKVYNNNVYLEPTTYTVEVTENTTTITLLDSPVEETVIQVLLLSDQVSNSAYYQIPDNLNNNPFNEDLTVADVGDIQNHYQDIFINAPNTTGQIFGRNNFRDCGDLISYGTKIIQNSASLALPGTFLRKTEHNVVDALLFNSREYIKYKQLLVDTVQNTDYVQRYTPSEILDAAIEQISASKSEVNSFFWSDMLPNKAPFRTTTYNFNSLADVTRYPLSQVYNFESANYNGVLVYLNRTVDNNLVQTQLLRNVDYTISTDSPSLTITLDLVPGDEVVIKEYNQTYGSYVPYTPSKLGLYALTQPSVVLDSDYTVPTYFIKGHDGSFTKLYGTYNPVTDVLVDFRDQALLEFEKRIYNNVKLSTEVPIKLYEILPGFFRDSTYSYAEWLQMYSTNFLNWVGQNRVDYKTQFFNRNNEFTYNYTNSGNKLNGAPINQGYWRGVYEYFYDTTTPNETPWEMLSFANEPTWWTARYGAAPYTSDNLVLWGDLAEGRVYSADGTSVIVPELARPGLLNILPVDSSGNLLSPLVSIVGNYNPSTFQKDWVVGDDGPVELSYRRSSSYPFDVIKLFALTRPAEFYNLAVDLDNYKYNSEFNQYLVNNRSHLIINDIEIYGNGTAKTSYINWVVDFEKQFGIDATNNITELFNNLDVRLIYRLAGYSDKTLLNFYVEKGSPNTANASLLIPDESYSVILYDNQPFDQLVFSSVVIQKIGNAYAVFGNSQTFAYFTVKAPINNGNNSRLEVLKQTVKVANDYTNTDVLIPYGTKFYSTQEVAQFISSYAAYLKSKGVTFDLIETGREINWDLMIQEFLYWTQTGWQDGSIITLNPSATVLAINKEGSIVQPLTLQQQNFILNQNLYPIQNNELNIRREGTAFIVNTLNEGDSMSFAQFNVSNFEHGIVFDNTTLFNDVIYNLVTGLRQNRITLRGTKTAEWNGTINTWGFILNQDNVKEWSKNIKYPKGVIVKYKNKYYAALTLIEPTATFNELNWKLINYNDIQKGLLPNSATRSYESTLYYNCNVANLEQDSDLLSYSLIGYRPRDYLALADLTDVAQINVYKNMIKNKGTINAVSAFDGATLPQGGIKYDVYENWAIKSGEYGGVLSQNFVEFGLNENVLTGNPSIVSLTNGVYTEGAQQEVPLYSLLNYGTPIVDPNILDTTTDYKNALYPSAGYANFDDVKMSAFFYSELANSVNKAGLVVPIQDFYVRDYFWLANFKEQWGIYAWQPIGAVISASPNSNGTATITFNKPHNLSRLDPIAIVNFAENVDGYFIVSQVVNLNQVIINLNISNTPDNIIQGLGIGLLVTSQRVAKPSDINNLPLLEAEFVKNTVWVDENTNGDWAVYRKNINYLREGQLTVNNTTNFGASVAHTNNVGYLISDPANGVVYRYSYNISTDDYEISQTITNDTSFGTKIAYSDNIFAISQPTTDPKVFVYVWNDTRVTNNLLECQVIDAPIGVTDWGSQIEISGDQNWIYISDNLNTKVYVYRRDSIEFNAGYFTTGETYTITSLYATVQAGSFTVGTTYTITQLGTTDFTLIGATSNEIGQTFVATAEGTGTGVATAPATDFTACGAVENSIGITFVASASVLANTMTAGYAYKIVTLSTTDWNAIGYVGTPTIGGTFVYNGASFTGSGTVTGNVSSTTGTAIQVTYQESAIIDGTSLGLTGTDGFGKSIATDHYSTAVFIGAPNKDYSGSITDWGSAYSYQRSVQRFEAQFTTVSYIPSTFVLGWSPATTSYDVLSTNGTTDVITLNTAAGISVNDPIIFTGVGLSGTNITENKTYYVAAAPVGNTITIKLSRSTTDVFNINTVGSITTATAILQDTPLYVVVNGTLVSDSNYGVSGNTLFYTGNLTAGDIVDVSGSSFYQSQSFNSNFADRINIQFGSALDVTQTSSELLIGSPFEISEENQEGSVYRFTNAGARFGVIVGEEECNLGADTTIFINGYSVNVLAGNATVVATAINNTNVPNVQASATEDNRLIIQIVDQNIANINNKLAVAAFDNTSLTQLGIAIYTPSQIITCPNEFGPTQFGKAIKFNEFDSVIIGAPVGANIVGTTFDFTDDENLDNDTVFDNNATRFVDSYPNSGAVYMFDLLSNYNGSATNPGAFVYAQTVNTPAIDVELSPLYGLAIDFNNNSVIVGAPNTIVTSATTGNVTTFVNATGIRDWSEFRQSSAIVDINKIQNTQIFSAITNNTLINLDYMDPLQDKLLGAIRENIDFVSSTDPASYNNDAASLTGYVWGAEQLGRIWFNTRNVRFVNYHQNDVVYNSEYWGTLFPGSTVLVATWVASNVPPSQYRGPGIPIDPSRYCVGSTMNASNVVTPVYYFWARNTNLIDRKREKTLADTVIAEYIQNPQSSGIAYLAPLLPNTFALYNSNQYINVADAVLHLGFASGSASDIVHNEYSLIRQNYADDFLPGLPASIYSPVTFPNRVLYPSTGEAEVPTSLYARMLDSLSGCAAGGEVVPNPFLPKAVQSGILARPRQSFFYNRLMAVQNYLTYANAILIQYPITEIRPNVTFAFAQDEFFNTPNFWNLTNWWLPGYSNDTRAAMLVPLYADLAELSVATGTIVKVEQNGQGLFEMYRYDANDVWTRIGLENGTFQFNSYLWDYDEAGFGFGNDFFDTTPYDLYPSEETRNIVRALNEQVYVGNLAEYRNKSLILLFEYIQSETIESQNYLPWLSKTSLADVFHTVRQLQPFQVFKSDNVEFLEGYLNEVKPYHVVIKEFLIKYDGLEEFTGDITDFDLPATYNTEVQQYITPQLVYSVPDNEYQYEVDSPIWSTLPYTQWYQNYGLSIVGEPNYNITAIQSYMDLGTRSVIVDNASGFPVNGVIQIGQETIAYSSVDRDLNILGGLSRGFNQTAISEHIPGEQVFIDLPPVVVLNEGEGYTFVPRVTADIDLSIHSAPRKAAILQAVMSGDRVTAITVVDPGDGYPTLPTINIESAYTVYFADTDINAALSTINVFASQLTTGEIVKFRSGSNGATPTKLQDNQWYYIGVLESLPAVVIALYTSYSDAVKDQNRIAIAPGLVSDNMSISPGARASIITSSAPIRENNITLRFDRTTYDSQVLDWETGAFYGAFFAGTYYNSDKVSSSAITLENVEPDINTVLASAQGVALQISNIENDRELSWSSFMRYVSGTFSSNNAIQLIPQDGNNPDLSELEPNASGTTNGFYVGMPVMFVGAVPAGLSENQTYYVSEIHDQLQFSVSLTDGGSSITLSNATIGQQGLVMYTAEVTDTAILTVDYPGILEVTATQATTNAITVPLTSVGTGGTIGFYTNLPLYFTGTTFSNVIPNLTYYVTTVIDNETFTISEFENPVSSTITATTTSTNVLTVESTVGFNRNDPIIITSLTGGLVTSNIVAGTTYYVSQIISSNQLSISAVVNGPLVALATTVGSATITSQKDVVQFETMTGSMTMNVSLPVSPGQINGQLFTLYQTSEQYPNVESESYSDLIVRNIRATIGTNYGVAVNRIAISELEGGTNNFYVNMPLRVSVNVGNLIAGTNYYITEYSGEEIPDPENAGETINRPNIKVEVTTTSSIGNVLVSTIDLLQGYIGTASLYEGMPIEFSGLGLGGIVIGQQYFVKNIIDATNFTISELPGGAALVVTTANGIMIGIGDPYIVVSDTIPLGSVFSLANDVPATNTVSFTQFVTGIPEFTLSYMVGGYRAIITDAGSGFAINNQIAISGTAVNGTSPRNDLTLTVNTIDEFGGITSVIRTGTPPEIASNYYLQVRSENTLAVYENALMTIPASGLELPYTGYTTATVTTATTDTLTVDTTGFENYDEVYFTGEIPTSIVLGQAYYLYNVTSTTTQVTEVPNDATTLVTGITFGSAFTMAKLGSIALLPEPFYFNQSVVKFNNRVYICVISNNDDEFIFGKWELVDSGDRRLNAMDRVIGYYQPTVNMPGVDLTQLFEGVTYPNSTYLGNAFQPDEQYTLDTTLVDLPFYPSDADVTGVVYDGSRYLASTNLPGYSAVLLSADGENWQITRLTNTNINLTNIVYNTPTYLITSSNPATPILVSSDGIVWTSDLYYIPFGTDTSIPYEVVALSNARLSINSAAYCSNGGAWIAVGESILRSTDDIIWEETVTFDPTYSYELYGVSPITGTNCMGLVAVGKGKEPDYSTGVTQLVDINLFFYSSDSINWSQSPALTNKGFYGVSSDSSIVISVGESGVIYYTQNGFDWFGINEVECTFVNSSTNVLNVTGTAGFVGGASGTPVRFNKAFSSIAANTTYYVKSIVSSTQVTLSDTLNGTEKTLTTSSVPAGTRMFIYDAADPNPATLRDLTYANGVWIAVGDNGTIKTSATGFIWNEVSLTITADLNSITYNASDTSFVASGENNTILTSTDNGVTWDETSIFTPIPTAYDVQGADFQFGYAPEELVAGVISDNFAMIVNTRPGTNWPVVEYGHTGYNAISVELTPTDGTQLEYSFANVAKVPAHVSIQVINGNTGLGTTLSPNSYDIDWVNKLVTLNAPLSFSPRLDKLRIDVYEVGNGDQLVKSSTDTLPIKTSATTGFNEIDLNCNYSAVIYAGSGALRPGTDNVNVRVFETEAIADRIFCDDVADFILNSPISFQGLPFGGLQEETVYYVKTISVASNAITVSEVYDTISGQAGPTTELTDATGEMFANIQNGVGAIWSDPVVDHNGEKLVFGGTGLITRTIASSDTIVTGTTSGLIVGTPITFGQASFGALVPFQRYYIQSIVDGNEFTISETQGGPVVSQVDFVGQTRYVTNDYAIGSRPGNQARLVFATNTYTNDTDYIVFSIFGETIPEQYGYALPETEYFAGNGSTAEFYLNNFVGYNNPNNAVVEVNGIRLTKSQYTIDPVLNVVTFVSPPIADSTVSVTTYNDTTRQYLTSQYNVTGNPGSSLVNLVVVATTQEVGTYDQDTPVVQTFDQDDPSIVLYDEFLNYLTLDSGGDDTSILNVNDSVQFSSPTLGGIVAGRTYYIIEIINSTDFVISEQVSGAPFEVFNDTGSMPVLANGLTVSGISNIINTIAPPIAITNATASTAGSPNEITVTDVTGFAVGQPVQFFGISFDANIETDGVVYFVKTIDTLNDKFTISNTQGGPTKTLAGGTGNMSVEVGGNPAIRVTTAIENKFVENTLIRIDGTEGSIQLNNNTYYAKIIDDFTFDLYNQPYSPAIGAVNDPVTTISAYTGGGYTWRQGLFFIATTVATATTSGTGFITVDSTTDLVAGTPVYFSLIEEKSGATLMGGLVQGQEYYVRSVETATAFTISNTRYGDPVTLTSDTGQIYVTQWSQENVDRLWVTVNGYRVPSSKLKVNPANEVSILTQITPGNQIIISSMIPTATPNEETYINYVDNTNNASVYRVNPQISTWLTQAINPLSDVIYVQDVTKLANLIVQTEVTPATVAGFYYIGLTADKTLIANVSVLNKTTGNVLPEEALSVVLIDLSPNVKIVPGAYITVGDELVITTLEGNIINVGSEQIRFGTADFENNTLGQLSRGVNGTARRSFTPTYTPVYGLLSSNKLPDIYYTQSWNSFVYNTVEGDPLQISDTLPANFLIASN
jgi:hypothetical protein